MEIRGSTIKYCKQKAKNIKMKKNYCTKKENDLQARGENNLHNRNIILEVQCARSRLKTSETISDSAECNLRFWYSSHTGPPPMPFSPLVVN